MGRETRAKTLVDRVFASNIRVVRQARGLSAESLSAALQSTETPLSRSALSKVETGDRRVTVGEAVNICATLDVNITAMTSAPLVAAVEVRFERDNN